MTQKIEIQLCSQLCSPYLQICQGDRYIEIEGSNQLSELLDDLAVAFSILKSKEGGEDENK
jgi:predicted ATP-dependent serine protease